MKNRQHKINKVRISSMVIAIIISVFITGTFVSNAEASYIRQGAHFEKLSKVFNHDILQKLGSRFSNHSLRDSIVEKVNNSKLGDADSTGVEVGKIGLDDLFPNRPGWFGRDKKDDNVNPIPEPATMLLFGTGLLGLAGSARLKKNKKS